MQSIIKRQFSRDATYLMDQRYFRMQQALDALKGLDLNARRRINCLIGHIGYGIHEFLPREPAYITMLREPVKRTISHYFFLRAHSKDMAPIRKILDQKGDLTLYERQFREHLRSEDTPANSIDAFLDMSINSKSLNLQTRMIAGLIQNDHVLPSYPALPENALYIAKKNLRHNISVFGLVEQFDESVLLLQSVFGWKNIFYTRKNMTRRSSNMPHIAPTTLRRIESHCELDSELYAYAQELFTERLQELPDLTASSLRRFRCRNALFQRLSKVYARSGFWHVNSYFSKLLAGDGRRP